MTGHHGEHALLGDLHTAALVSDSGALDWLCLPRFDSAACFAALSGDQRAGAWHMGPAAGGRATRRRYRPDTLVLETEWDTPEGTVRLVDCMPPRTDVARVVRVFEGVSGDVPVHVRFAPRFDNGRRSPWLRRTARAVSAVAGADALWLDADVPFDRPDANGVAEARCTVSAGQRVGFVLTHAPSHQPRPSAPAAADAIDAAERFWSTWLSCLDTAGPWDSAMRRALITLRALTYAPTGAVVTAPVLPDGRFCWLRDASSTLSALLDAGLADEARAWREWLVRAVAGDASEVSAHYTVDGRGDPATRTGRHAVGEVLYGLNLADELWLSSHDPSWDLQLGLLDHLESTWRQPDDQAGTHLVHSKVMAWAGVDRALRTAQRHGLPCPLDDWQALRSRIRADVCAKGYDPDRNTFTRHYGSDDVDPALLLMPEVGFLPWRDVRMRGTVAAVGAAMRGLFEPVSLPKDTPFSSGFWLASAWYGTGNTFAGKALFEHLLTARNDVGLFGEVYDPGGRHAGRAPHTASTVSMINAGYRLRSTVR